MAEEEAAIVGKLGPEALADAFDRFAGAAGVDWATFASGFVDGGLAKSFGASQPVGQAVQVDPYRWAAAGQGYFERPSRMGWGTLKRMAETPIIASIIGVRVGQVQQYAVPQENQYLPGFQIRLRNRKKHPTRTETRMIEDLTQWVVQCGTITDSRQLLIRSGLTAFTAAVIRDSLTYDQLCAEVIPTRGSRLRRDGAPVPARLQWVDASTIRIAECFDDGMGVPDDDFDTPRHVQVVDGVVVGEFEPSRLMFGVRNPATSIYQMGYGVAEQELLARVLTAWLNVFTRNYNYFTQGFNARGFLNFKQDANSPALDEKQMYAVRRELQILAAGVGGAHRVVTTSSPGVEFVNIGGEVVDAQWLGFSDQGVKLICALHRIDPAEINHMYGNTGQTSAMGGSPMAEKVEESKARGLVPLVNFYFDCLNRWVIQQVDPDFEIAPTGTSSREEGDEIELDTKRVTSIMTLDEVRARRDLPPMKRGGDVVLNPAYLQAVGMSSGDGGDGQGQDEGGDAPEELDTSSFFSPQQDGQDDQQFGGDAPDVGGAPKPVIQQSQPLAASRVRRMQRTTITL